MGKDRNFAEISEEAHKKDLEDWKEYTEFLPYEKYQQLAEERFQKDVTREQVKIYLYNKALTLRKEVNWRLSGKIDAEFCDQWNQYDSKKNAPDSGLSEEEIQKLSEAQEEFRKKIREKFKDQNTEAARKDVQEVAGLVGETLTDEEAELRLLTQLNYKDIRNFFVETGRKNGVNLDKLPKVLLKAPKDQPFPEKASDREWVEAELRKHESYLFPTYADYHQEYRKRHLEKLDTEVTRLLEELARTESYRERCAEIEKWKKLAEKPSFTEEDLTFIQNRRNAENAPVPAEGDQETGQPEKKEPPVTNRRYCINQCLEAVNALMESMETYVSEGADRQRMEIKKGELLPGNTVKELAIEVSDIVKDDYEKVAVLLGRITSLCDSLESKYDGDLEVPAKGTGQIGGKTVHWVSTSDEKIIHSRAMYELGSDGNVEEVDREARDVPKLFDYRDRPLFEKEPDPSDLRQGDVGDCYFIAALAAIAARDPQKIKDAMHDNGDGTVTVRFYNSEQEPVFVTVTKEIPGRESKAYERNPNGRLLYSQGALWAMVMEKAYAASGLANSYNENDESLQEENERDIDYQKLEGGGSVIALSHLLGTPVPTKECRDARAIPFPDAASEYDVIPYKEVQYSPRELRLAEYMRKGLHEGKLLFLSTRSEFSPDEEKGLKKKGIHHRHAYTFLGLDEDNDGTIYVRYRNPHARKGLIHSGGQKNLKESLHESGGFGRMELHEFTKYFGAVSALDYDFSPTRIDNYKESKEIIQCYGDTVRRIQQTLNQNDRVFLALSNSREFKNFRIAANQAAETMDETCPDPVKIREAMDHLFSAAENYNRYCKETKKIDTRTATGRALIRYKMSEVTKKLKKIYCSNEPADHTYHERMKVFNPDKKSCSFDLLSEETKIPTNRWELLKITDEAGSAAVTAIDRSTLSDRMMYYQHIRKFFQEQSYTRFFTEEFGKMNAEGKLKFLKANRLSLEIMAAAANHAEELKEKMEKDKMGAEYTDLLKKSSDLQKLLKKLHADADPVKFGKSGEKVPDSEEIRQSLAALRPNQKKALRR